MAYVMLCPKHISVLMPSWKRGYGDIQNIYTTFCPFKRNKSTRAIAMSTALHYTQHTQFSFCQPAKQALYPFYTREYQSVVWLSQLPKVILLLTTEEAFGTSSVWLQNPGSLYNNHGDLQRQEAKHTNRQHRHVKSSKPGSVGPKVPALQPPTPIDLDEHLMPVHLTTKTLARGQSPAFLSSHSGNIQ